MSPEDLSEAIQKDETTLQSQRIRDYLCQLLAGEVTKPRGPKARNPIEVVLEERFIANLYYRNFRWLRERKARFGHLEGWSCIKNAKFWRGPPSEKAARMVAAAMRWDERRYRHVLNVASSSK